jgi:nitrate/TMAO reductase-like tetraheme cytochrome c subunit
MGFFRFFTKRFAQMTKGGIAGFLTVLVFAGMAGFFWFARTIKTTPYECATCHPEITEMWKGSQGHPAAQVTCYECHAPHAAPPESANVPALVRDELIPPRYYSADELVEARCEGCHPKMREAETEVKKVIKVNHKVHLVTAKDTQGKPLAMRCLDCHRNITHDKAQIETNRPTMEGCFAGQCHPKDRNKDNCRRCHYQQLAEPGQQVL